MSTPARAVVVVVGLAALVIGVVFAGQGLNLIPGSFMTGDRKWLYIGLVLAVAGLVMVVPGSAAVGVPRADVAHALRPPAR